MIKPSEKLTRDILIASGSIKFMLWNPSPGFMGAGNPAGMSLAVSILYFLSSPGK